MGKRKKMTGGDQIGPTDDQRLRTALAVIQTRLNRMLVYHTGSTAEDHGGVDIRLECLSGDRIELLKSRIRDRMTHEDSLQFGQILGRTLWNSWDHLPSGVRNAIRSSLGMEFSVLVRLGRFPELEEDPQSPKSRSKQYVLKQRPRSEAKSCRRIQRDEASRQARAASPKGGMLKGGPIKP